MCICIFPMFLYVFGFKVIKYPIFSNNSLPLYNEKGFKTKVYRWMYKLSILMAKDVIFISEFVRKNVQNGLGIKQKNMGNIVYNGSEDPYHSEVDQDYILKRNDDNFLGFVLLAN
ncbi:hypothetical protein BANRA_03145 [Klebsiella pneumoniae]|nr:hypothetical protein BANRA_03145 [Klebsiella pneumoniae]